MARAICMRIIVLGLMLAGCASGQPKPAAAGPSPAVPDWRRMATQQDRQRIRTWRDSWIKALAEVDAAGDSPKLAPMGRLMQPDAAMTEATPAPGDYLCRTYKLGAKETGDPAFAELPASTCRIAAEKDVLSFAMLSGPQKPVGFLLAGDESRMIFLGTMLLGDERRALDYGSDPERDMAGAFERIGPKRWRLVLPFPHWESTLEVIELTPQS